MVRLHLHYPNRRGEPREFKSTQEAAKYLWLEEKDAHRAVLHCPGDGEMLRFLDWAEQAVTDRVQNAMLGSVNPTVEVWAIEMTVADGAGWRLVLRRNAMQLQALAQGPGGDSAPARLHQ